MTEPRIEDLIREINPITFSASAHGEGHRIVHSPTETRPYKKTLFGRFISGRDERQYFVKRFRVPKEVKDWDFHWSEGTSAISLDFDSNFVIQANENTQAIKLVEALGGAEKPGAALYGLINANLHAELERLLRECQNTAASLLDSFRRASIGIGESERLNSRVSERVTQALGGAYFRIGFQLKNAPPPQVEVRSDDTFDLRDSSNSRKATTKALLQLVNYQDYKKSNLSTEADIRKSIQSAIALAVKDLLWGKQYYEIVRSFRNGNESVESRMRERIASEAKAIGYSVTMFQTLPDIAALDLLGWQRIDIDAKDQKYSLKDSTSDVQLDVALTVRAEGDFEKLRALVTPDDSDALVPVTQRVTQICRDSLKMFSWQDFNLEFDTKIASHLRTAITDHLSQCGLATQIIRVAQAPTEDANRFKTLRGRTTDFEVNVSPQANVGNADVVTIRGKVEVTGMPQLGWGCFESKDFGFRSDSRVSEARMRQEAQKRGLALPETNPLPAGERQALAIDLELLEIRDRVVSTLKESLSKVRDLASSWRTLESSNKIIKWAQKEATNAVEQEFGLAIALRSVFREDTPSETTALLQQHKANELARALLGQDVDRETELEQVRGKHAVAMATNSGMKDIEALDDEDHLRHTEVRGVAAAQLTGNTAAPRLTAESAAALLKQPDLKDHPRLPWIEDPDNSQSQGAGP
jgi:hypothetical protein